jgi:DNA-binding MarR family transcriptional regulator
MSEANKELSIEYLQQRIQSVKDMNPHMNICENSIITTRLMIQAVKNIEKQIELDMNKDGLVGASWMVLVIAYSSNEQKIIASDICETLGQNKSTTSRIIESLIEKKFVERMADGEDRRKVYLHITNEGKQYVQSKLALHHEYNEKIWKNININEFLPAFRHYL